MLRRLKEDFRAVPATMVLCALWLLVFAAMTIQHVRQGHGLSIYEFLLGLRGGHRFGDMTLHELFEGEIWRPLTASFVHYGILHIGMNLYALYQLGALVEEWYGAGVFLGIYVLTGTLGNLLSALFRSWSGASHWIASGGGSTVVMGLVGLCAVVGWRSRSKFGKYLRDQMVFVMALTFGLGLLLDLCGLPMVDNWGHAGGTIVGAGIGLAHSWLERLRLKRAAIGIGFVGTLLIVAGAAAQYRDDRNEMRRREQIAREQRRYADDLDDVLIRLEEVRQTYRAVVSPRIIHRGAIVRRIPSAPKPLEANLDPLLITSDGQGADTIEDLFFQDVIEATSKTLASLRPMLDHPLTANDYRRLEQLTDQTRNEPPTLDEFREYQRRMNHLQAAVRRDRDIARAQAITIGFLPRID